MPDQLSTSGLYGLPPGDLVEAPSDAIQFSPLKPGSADLAGIEPGSLSEMVVLAPPGTLERRRILALALRALTVGGRLTALAPKAKGGQRLAPELTEFGCGIGETSRRHHRIVETLRPASPVGLDAAIAAGDLRLDPDLGLWTQPGAFAFDRVDPGSALLLEHLPKLSGRGADLGCGIGILSRAVLRHPEVTALHGVDIDRRALAAARRNVEDARATFLWADALGPEAVPAGLDFVVMNPPFHEDGVENRALGQGFIARAHAALRPGGFLHMTANRHLPYEAVLSGLFKTVAMRAEGGGYKIFEARR
ncbi:methyltransferase [Aureimonas sp. Leaf454]|uniref:class I SAM-dependent methyltransferase n=1 Tax=Aureimonas sp. Leaf454 TaxID=1736381 RepID=UPI0012E38880|nr:methyltransferase [Aureimonas sp. Leaf454]